MKKIFLALLLSVLFHQSYCQETAFQKDIKELLELTGSSELGLQVASEMANSFRQALPDVPSEFWDEFVNSIKKDDLTNLVMPIYEKYYTHEDVKLLIEFYKTPIGQKTIQVLPAVTQESMMVGQEWGAALGEEVYKKLQEGGHIKE